MPCCLRPGRAPPAQQRDDLRASGASIATERHSQALELAAVERRAIATLLDAAEAWGYATGLPRGRVLVYFAEQHAVADPLRREEPGGQRRRGGTNPVEAYMLDHPGVTPDEAEAAVQENIRRTTEITAEPAARQAASPTNAPSRRLRDRGVITGREGGQARGGAQA